MKYIYFNSVLLLCLTFLSVNSFLSVPLVTIPLSHAAASQTYRQQLDSLHLTSDVPSFLLLSGLSSFLKYRLTPANTYSSIRYTMSCVDISFSPLKTKPPLSLNLNISDKLMKRAQRSRYKGFRAYQYDVFIKTYH